MADLCQDRPLDPVGSIKVKIGLLVALSILAATVVLQIGTRAGVPAWLTLPVTLAAALGVTQWLARGMTAPLREMTAATAQMARGDYRARVSATSADEVGQLGRAFNTMATDLASADQQRRQLIATVSHELRTPLAGQRALLENLVDGIVTPDDAALAAALNQSERLSALVEDLLDVSRVGGAGVALQLEQIEVAELLQEAVRESEVSGRTVSYRVTLDPVDLRVQADPARLRQVVANLLDNASRHSPHQGVVGLQAGLLPAQDRWFLEVTDQGPGISVEQAETLFRRFGSADGSGGGTGLGLAIASWACQLHGGSISALPPTEEQPGARLRVELPLEPANSPSNAPAEPRPAQRSAGETGAATDEGPTRTPAAPLSEHRWMSVGDHPTGPAPAGIASSTSVIESMFGSYWPERSGLRTAPLALFASLAIGLLAALILPEQPLGLGTFLVLVSAGGLVLWVSIHRRRRWTLLSAVLCLGLGLLLLLRAAEWLSVLAVLTAAVLVTTALTDAHRPSAMIAGAASWVLSGLRGLPLLGRTLTATSRHHVVWPVLRTAAVSLVLLVLFVGLFASGDALFGSWVSGILPDIQIADSLVLRAFTWFMVGGTVLAACYLGLNPPRVETVGLGQARAVQRTWEWLVPVAVVIATFLGFLSAQAAALFGGHGYLRRTTGLTYAEYVHQGFAQLVVATLLTLLTIAITVRKAPSATRAQQQLVRLTLGVLCVLTLVVVGSALNRMALYQQAYGYTVLRVLVDAFELWLGLIVVMVMAGGLRWSWRWLPRAALATGAAFLLVIGLANPEAWVAQRNIERFEQTGRLDLDYLSSLGPDATATIIDGLPQDLARCARPGVPAIDDDLLGWNLGRARAAQAQRDAMAVELPEDCPATIGE